jgi:hypothetical protein
VTGCLDVLPGEPVDRLGLGVVAVKYQRLGWAVLALGVGQKIPHPAFKHGVLWASRHADMVEQVWGADRLAGIGIATGAASGLLVVDLDRHGAKDGLLVWQSFLAVNGLYAPPGPWVQTPSGGEHHYYRLPPGEWLPQRRDILDGVDLKIDGGYVVAPPTMVKISYDARQPGQVLLPYRWNGCPCTLPVAPDWMIRWAKNAPAAGSSGQGAATSEGGALPDLTEHYRDGMPVGLRNIALMQLACQQFARYGSHDPYGQARVAIDRVLAATDRAGFHAGEIERTIASARDFIARREREDEEAAASVPRWWAHGGHP